MSYSSEPIGEYVENITKWNPSIAKQTEPFLYIDLSSVDKDKKNIDRNLVTEILPSEAPSRARQIVNHNDILVSTVRPNLNGIALVDKELDGATSSTGYCVLRPQIDKLSSKYLYYWVQTNSFIRNMMKKSTGANYPAVSDKIIKESVIPLPPLPEQKRIAAILDKADAIRRKRQQAIDLADQYLRSVFLDMFGDPVTNPKGWEVKKLKDLTIKIGSGSTPRGGKNAYISEGVSLIRSLNIHDNKFVYKDLAHINEDQAEKLKNVILEKDDVLLNITGASVCRCAIVPNEVLPARVNQHVCIIRVNKKSITPIYFQRLLTSDNYKKKLLNIATSSGATREALTKDQVENILIPCPPKEMQQKFEHILVRANSILKNNQIFGQNSNMIFSSLSQQAFAGKL